MDGVRDICNCGSSLDDKNDYMDCREGDILTGFIVVMAVLIMVAFVGAAFEWFIIIALRLVEW